MLPTPFKRKDIFCEESNIAGKYNVLLRFHIFIAKIQNFRIEIKKNLCE